MKKVFYNYTLNLHQIGIPNAVLFQDIDPFANFLKWLYGGNISWVYIWHFWLWSFQWEKLNYLNKPILYVFVCILVSYVHVLGMTCGVTFPSIKISFTFSTFIMKGSLTKIFTSFAASDSTTNSASELNGVMILCGIGCQDKDKPKILGTNPCMLSLLLDLQHGHYHCTQCPRVSYHSLLAPT